MTVIKDAKSHLSSCLSLWFKKPDILAIGQPGSQWSMSERTKSVRERTVDKVKSYARRSRVGRFGHSFRSIRAPPAHQECNQSPNAYDDSDYLRGRKSGQRGQAENVAAGIVTHEFDQKTHGRVNQRVGQNHLAAEFLSLM